LSSRKVSWRVQKNPSSSLPKNTITNAGKTEKMSCKCVLLHWQASGDFSVEIEVKHKLSEDQCSGSVLSDLTSLESAQLLALKRQSRKRTETGLEQKQRQSGEVKFYSNLQSLTVIDVDSCLRKLGCYFATFNLPKTCLNHA